MHAQETKEEQVKVAYVYNFLQNISWQNENKIAKYRLLVASKNETLKNMFLMLASRKQLKNKNLEVYNNEDNIINNIIDEHFEENDDLLIKVLEHFNKPDSEKPFINVIKRIRRFIYA